MGKIKVFAIAMISLGLIVMVLGVGASGVVRWNGLVPELMLFTLTLCYLGVSWTFPRRRSRS